MNVSEVDILIGALTIYGEGRGCTQAGRLAIAHVILNRMKARSWYGRGVENHPDHSMGAVCMKPWQFSCWNPNDPNEAIITNLKVQYRLAIRSYHCRASLKALIDALDGYKDDPTNGATHYLTASLHVSGRCPAWAAGRTDYIQIGAHRFFSGVD